MSNPLVVILDGFLSQHILSHFLHIESKTAYNHKECAVRFVINLCGILRAADVNKRLFVACH